MMYFEIFHKLQQYALICPEKIDRITQAELEQVIFKENGGKENGNDDGSGISGGYIGGMCI